MREYVKVIPRVFTDYYGQHRIEWRWEVRRRHVWWPWAFIQDAGRNVDGVAAAFEEGHQAIKERRERRKLELEANLELKRHQK